MDYFNHPDGDIVARKLDDWHFFRVLLIDWHQSRIKAFFLFQNVSEGKGMILCFMYKVLNCHIT